MLQKNRNSAKSQIGLSLVEIMVGMVIGLLTTLVIMQVFSLFEGQRRTTTGTADAQTNGSIALFNIQRDVQMAGFGLPVFDTVNPPLRCNPTVTVDHDSDAITPNIDMFPIRVVDGGAAAGASDTIMVRYGQTPMGGVPIRIIDPANATNATGLSVDNNMNCTNDDIVLIVNGSACNMTRIVDTDLTTDTSHITLSNGTGAATNASISCLGNWNEFTYRVTDNELQRNVAGSLVFTPIVTDIVNIQAQYGVSATQNSNQVTQWVNASGGTWGNPTVANRNRIKAVRIAVVARNGLLEKEDVTSACNSTTLTEPTGLCAWEGNVDSPAPAIDLSKNADGTANPDWQRYRYRVFETIIPLRNMIWSWNTL
jgi:type IV pilus assembly protein PilW